MRSKIILILAGALVLEACGDSTGAPDPDGADAPPQTPTNRIQLPGNVRQNLGITWEKARQGRLERIHSVPGEIVARPDHSWTVHAPLSGTVTRVAQLWQSLEAGDIVVEIASSKLAEMQTGLYAEHARAEEARMAISLALAGVQPTRALADTLIQAAKDARAAVTRAEIALDNARLVAKEAQLRLAEVERLRESDAVSAPVLLAARLGALEQKRGANTAHRTLRTARVEAAEHSLRAATAQVNVTESERRLALLAAGLSSAEAAFESRLAALAATSGLTTEALSVSENGTPAWARMRKLALRAPDAGVVVTVHTSAGTWIDQDEPLVGILDPSQLAFRALIPEGDVAHLPGKFSMRIEVPGIERSLETTLSEIRPVAHAATRSVLLEGFVANPDGRLRVGTSATAHVITGLAAGEEVLVPLDCVVRDGLESVVFRRDPADPDQVIRTLVTLGAKSAGWIEVIAGVGAGDELVRNGVHQLRQTGLGKASATGHFHADGTWHEEHK